MSPRKTPARSKSTEKPAKRATARAKPTPKRPVAKKAPARKTPRKAKAVAPPPVRNPEAEKLARQIGALVLDKKASDVLLLDVHGKTSYADWFVLASGDSERQVLAMASHVDETLKKEGRKPIGIEGRDTGHWVLLDYGEVVAHLFSNELRTFYDLEGLWSDAPKEALA